MEARKRRLLLYISFLRSNMKSLEVAFPPLEYDKYEVDKESIEEEDDPHAWYRKKDDINDNSGGVFLKV